MISLEDCIGLCGLDEKEVAAISEHEHISEIAAAALANYLMKQPHGGEIIRTMIIDAIHKSARRRSRQTCSGTAHGSAAFPRREP
jgi:hypothetical protein